MVGASLPIFSGGSMTKKMTYGELVLVFVREAMV
jgi:hypothetical protein